MIRNEESFEIIKDISRPSIYSTQTRDPQTIYDPGDE